MLDENGNGERLWVAEQMLNDVWRSKWKWCLAFSVRRFWCVSIAVEAICCIFCVAVCECICVCVSVGVCVFNIDWSCPVASNALSLFGKWLRMNEAQCDRIVVIVKRTKQSNVAYYSYIQYLCVQRMCHEQPRARTKLNEWISIHSWLWTPLRFS